MVYVLGIVFMLVGVFVFVVVYVCVSVCVSTTLAPLTDKMEQSAKHFFDSPG